MSTEEDIEMLKAKLAEQEKAIAQNEQEKVDNSSGHKLIILAILLVLGGLAIYFTGNWPTVVKLYYRLYQQFMEGFVQFRAALQDLIKMV